MSDHQRETAFLRQCIRYDDTEEQHRLEERIMGIQRDERTVRRAVWLMVLLAALGVAGLGYTAVLMADYPSNMSRFTEPWVTKVFFALSGGSVICLAAFLGLGVVYRKRLDRRREECRRLVAKIMASRLGNPGATPLPAAQDNPVREDVGRTARVAIGAAAAPEGTGN